MSTRTCQSGVEHVYDPDSHFCCKMRYMRENGSLAVHYPYGGRETFKGPTIRERQDKIVADAAAQGRSVRLVNPTYDRPPGVFNDPSRGGPATSSAVVA